MRGLLQIVVATTQYDIITSSAKGVTGETSSTSWQPANKEVGQWPARGWPVVCVWLACARSVISQCSVYGWPVLGLCSVGALGG